MATHRIYRGIRGETGLADALVDIYDSGGTQTITNGAMTELGSTGIYYYDFTWTTSGVYLAVVKSATLTFQQDFQFEVGTVSSTSASTTPASSVTFTDVKYSIGRVWNMIDIADTTSTVVNALIGNAEADIALVTGTTTGYAQAIRNLACAYVVNSAVGGQGPESDDETKLINMRDSFIEYTKHNLRRKGKDFEKITPAWVQVNN